ncbi:hypothetical protein [Nonomuraea lactucae]|uniref:hypothetical protein n=1 Tax=Nonomuraea lactucae TaxID=2249762 RepID=UPI000DE536BA|nr:hypothetical protein [Nonomuraea lactucae]
MNDDRTDLITGLRKLADFLTAHPEIPVHLPHVTLNQFPARGSDAEMCAEVDKIAALLGAEISKPTNSYGHYSTGLSFGPVRYSFTAIPAAARARHDADDSYHGCIQPDPTPTT